MKQLLQSLSNGDTEIVNIPYPQVKPKHLLIQSCASLVSAGTERMLVEFGQANWIDKARQQPDKVKMVLDKIKTDGLLPTLDAVQSKLDQPLPMGYSNAGVVVEVGAGVTGFTVGDRVISNGSHAELVCVPQNLCAKIPDGVSNEAAAFTVIGAIALQGIRLAQPTLGETFVVTGLGLIGLITVQLLRSHGCRVLALDFNPQRLKLAQQFGAKTVNLGQGEDAIAKAQLFSQGQGIDGVIVTAATKSNEPIHQAAQMCRKRGRIILVGVVGLELSRADFYEKELTFQVSCSYGPGRYDPNYEQQGQDYPLGFVRWTAQRNFTAILEQLATNALDVAPLISHRFPFDQAAQAYQLLSSSTPSLGILLEYPATDTATIAQQTTIQLASPISPLSPTVPCIGFIGAGNYATRILIPAFQQTSAILKTIATQGGVSGIYAGRKFGFQQTTTDTDSLFSDSEINTLVIATRHNSHAELVCQALNASKNVFVEKPLAITPEQLQKIQSTYHHLTSPPLIMVGFNRRFAPQIQKIRILLTRQTTPKTLIMTINAGAIPAQHWTQDQEIGGGRIIGEACHFIDLLRFLVGYPITNVQTTKLQEATKATIPCDNVTCSLSFADGSMGTVHYLANGHKSFPKERLEIFWGGKILQLDNFRKLRGYGFSDFQTMNLWRQDKGNQACATAFIEAISNGKPSPISFAELIEVTQVSLEITNLTASKNTFAHS
ncbi:MAG: Gfo/Idh/MocA family oxidoreductase [Symploca sp. SIO2D2]|nr:Gfo/Idh/MocA family oxidoreductase [Symploca sp. SIO2D2]